MSKGSMVLGYKVDMETYRRVKERATSVKYRTISSYLRELVDADLAEVERQAAAEHMAKLASA